MTNDRSIATRQHIGRMNILAISGGRCCAYTNGTVILPVSHGYSVEVTYDEATDAYGVARVLNRKGRRTVKRYWDLVHAEQVAEIAWTASLAN